VRGMVGGLGVLLAVMGGSTSEGWDGLGWPVVALGHLRPTRTACRNVAHRVG
jgi:hypothetical protein